MKRTSLVSIGVLLGVLAAVGTSWGFVGQRSGDHPLRWTRDLVRFTIHELGEPAIDDGSDRLAVRLAFRAWELADSRLRFVEETDPAQRARSDWQSDDVHLVVWDETNASGLFGGASGLVAVTPLDFDPRSGEILDADILLNGRRPFATNLSAGSFDIQSIVTHEVGHFVGLDHSPVEGATMTPITAYGDTRLRSLEADDKAGVVARYPLVSALGTIEGSVLRRGRAVAGAHVVAENEDGEPVSATLSDSRGVYRLVGLAAGSYAVYAEPLTGRVTAGDLQLSSSNQVVDTQFGTTFYGASGRSSPASPERVSLSAGETRHLGALDALEANAMKLSLLWSEVARPGDAHTLVISGDGLDAADGLVVPGRASDLRVSGVQFSAGSVRATLDVSPYAAAGLRTVRAFRRDTWACATLTGRLEVREPGPAIRGLSRTSAAPRTQIRVDGSGFESGSRVLFGGAVATSWLSGACLEFVVPDVPNGEVAVVVENPDGQAGVVRGFRVEGSQVAAPLAPGSTPAAAPAPGAATSGGPAFSKSGSASSDGCTLGTGGGTPFSALALFALLSLLLVRREAP